MALLTRVKDLRNLGLTATSRQALEASGRKLWPGLRKSEVIEIDPINDEASGSPYHHIPGGFRNPPTDLARKRNFTGRIEYSGERIRMILQDDIPTPPEGHLLTEDQALTQLASMNGSDSLTWLGHSSFLLRMSGKNILFDPFLSDLATPVPPFGLRRMAPPGISLQRLPRIDMLVVSHNHCDHLDSRTVEALPNKNHIAVIVPLKLGDFFRQRGYKWVRELDWFEHESARGVTVTALPAIHYSGRGLFDRNQTLWASFSVRTGLKNVFFAGDTAYGSLFKGIGEEYGPFDLGLVPIGAYEPRRLMRHIHTSPEEAVMMSKDLGLRTLVAMHWGTLPLATEPRFEAGPRFLASALEAGYQRDDVWVMAVGQTRPLAG